MQRSVSRVVAACVLLLGGFAMALSAKEALGCANMISGDIGHPVTGYLIGTETRTQTWTVTVITAPGGVGGSAASTVSVTYDVGFYRDVRRHTAGYRLSELRRHFLSPPFGGDRHHAGPAPRRPLRRLPPLVCPLRVAREAAVRPRRPGSGMRRWLE